MFLSDIISAPAAGTAVPDSQEPRGLTLEQITGIAPPPTLWERMKSSYAKATETLAPGLAQGQAGLRQLDLERKAAVNMGVGIPGGVAGVAMDAASRLSSYSWKEDPRMAGFKARAVADQVNQDWGKITSALGLTQDATGSKIEQLMNWGMEASDKGGASLETATKGVMSLETTQSVRDTLLNALGVRGLKAKPKAGGAPTAELFSKETQLKEATAQEAKIQEAAQTGPATEAAAVQDLVTDALSRRTRLETYWAGQKGRAKAPDPWEKTVAALVEDKPAAPVSVDPATLQAGIENYKRGDAVSAEQLQAIKEQTPKVDAPDLVQSALDNLRAGVLISKEQAKAIRQLTPRPGEGTIVDPKGKAYFQRGAVDPDVLVKTLGIMGLGAVAAKVLTDWYSSGGLSGDNSTDYTNLAAGLMGATILRKGDGPFKGATDAKLVEGFRAGGAQLEAAARELHDTTRSQLERSLNSFKDQVDVEGVVQDTYRKAFEKLALPAGHEAAFRGDAKISSWLIGNAKREALDQIRRGEVRPDATSESLSPVSEDAAPNAAHEAAQADFTTPETTLANQQLAQRMQTALDKINPDFRDAFMAAEVEGLSMKEIGERLGIDESTARTRIFRAKAQLQSQFKDYVDPRTGKFQQGKVNSDLLVGLGSIAGGAAVGAALDPEHSVSSAVYGALAGGALGTGAGRAALKAAIKSPDAALGLISTRLGNIHSSLKLAMRTHELNVLKSIDKMNDLTLPFMQAVDRLKGEESLRASRALLNGDVEAIKSIPALRETYPAIQTVLSHLETQLQGLGRFAEGVTNYFPRIVKDFEGLKKAMGGQAAQGLEKTLLDAEASMNRKEHRALTELEQSIITNRYLFAPDQGSFLPGFAKSRRMKEIPESLQQFYEPPVESLLRYISGAANDIETARFFGRDLTTSKQGKKIYTDVDGSIGNLTARLLNEGKITQAQSMELRDILKARFEGGEKGMNPALANIRNATNAALLGNVASAATQVGDSFTTVYHQGLVPTLQAVTAKILGKERITPKQLGLINHIAEELSDRGPVGQLLHTTMKYSGFHAIDMFAKGLGLNAALIRNEKLVSTPEGQAKFRAKYQTAFGEETAALIDDLKNKRVTDRVEQLVFSELSDMQPISKAEMTEMYLAHPNGRFLYQLKTYLLKQVDIVRRDAYQEIAKGTPEGIIRGTKNLAALATVYAIANVPGDVIKDWMAGRPIDPLSTPRLVENIGQTFGINRYAGQQLGQGKVVETATSMATPPLRVLQDIAKMEPKAVGYVPFIGRPVADRYFGGNERKEIYETRSLNKGVPEYQRKSLSPAARKYLIEKRVETDRKKFADYQRKVAP